MKNYTYIETYGCSANKNNSEILKGILTQSGYIITNNEKIADIIILNTCIVKGKTENKIKRRIQDLSDLYKNKLMIIAGCMSNTDKEQLKKINPNLILLGTNHFKEITSLLKDYFENRLIEKIQNEYISEKMEQKLNLPKIPDNKLISITQISEGCLGNCSFCKTRIAKGKLFSYDREDILKSIESDLKQGAKEVWITSQDNAAFGIDKTNKSELIELLNGILALKHNFKLRLGMMNPNNVYPILNDLIEIYKNKKMYKFLHIPIQSASNKILKDMNRKYKIEIVEEIIKRFKKEFPDMTISTDIITGYPTENKEDHKLNLDFINKFKPDVFNLSKFSSHKQTNSGKLTPLKKDIINKRASELMELHRKTAMENKIRFLNKEINVLINSKTKIPNVYEARDENYNIVLIKGDRASLGKNILVRIKSTGVHHMIGDMI